MDKYNEQCGVVPRMEGLPTRMSIREGAPVLIVLTVLVTLMLSTVPRRAMAGSSQGNSWYSVSQENGYEITSSEQVRAAYYLFATEGQSWWTGEYYAPSEKYVSELSSSESFTAAVIAWKSANIVFSPDKVGKFLAGINPLTNEAYTEEDYEKVVHKTDPLGEKGYYETILFDILYEQSYSVKMLDSINASLKKNQVDVLHTVYKECRTSFGLDYQIGNGLTYNEAQLVDQCLWDQYFNEGLYSYEAKFKKYLDEVNTIEQKAERVANLLAMQDVADSQILVLEKLRDACTGYESLYSLKEACDELLLVCDQQSFGAKYFIASQMFPISIEDGLKTLYSKLWTGVTNSLGGAWKTMSGAYNLGKTLCNVWLSTDATIEKYFQMRCLMAIRQLLNSICRDARSRYLGSPTNSNAESYVAIVDMLMGVYELELTQSKAYVSILDGTVLNRVLNNFGSNATYSALMTQFDNRRVAMQRHYDLSKEITSEMAAQYSDCHKAVYEDYAVTINSQQEFDWYCQIYADMKGINESWVSRLPINPVKNPLAMPVVRPMVPPITSPL